MSNQDRPIKDVSYISKINKTRVLKLIRERRTLSRSDIAKEIGLSLPTVSRLVDSLVHSERLLRELGARSTARGRPPNLVSFAGDRNFVIGMSLGRVHISAVLTDLDANLIAEQRIPTDAQKGFRSVVRRSANLVRKLMSNSDVEPDCVLGVGVAVGGLVDAERNRVIYSATLGWENEDLGGALEEILERPVRVDHDARVMALGELSFGIGDRMRNFICVLAGYGIGASFIVDGRPFYGKQGMTGELGHLVVAEDSRIECSCGHRGCLDALASGRAIGLRAQQETATDQKGSLYRLCNRDPSRISAETVASAAQDGDPTARRILDEAAGYLGVGLVSLIHLYNPEAVVLGGGLTQIGDFFFERIQDVVKQRGMPQITDGLAIERATLGNKARIMGAVALVVDEILNLNLSVHPGRSAVAKNGESARGPIC